MDGWGRLNCGAMLAGVEGFVLGKGMDDRLGFVADDEEKLGLGEDGNPRRCTT